MFYCLLLLRRISGGSNCHFASALSRERLMVSTVVVLPTYGSSFLPLRAGHHSHADQKQHPHVYKPAADTAVFASEMDMIRTVTASPWLRVPLTRLCACCAHLGTQTPSL